MQLPLAVAEAGQNTGLFPRLGQLHPPLAEPQGQQLAIRYLDLPVDNTIANAVHHVATFNSHVFSYAGRGIRCLLSLRSQGGGDGRPAAREARGSYRPARLCSLS